MKSFEMQKKGFTLIELLVVIAIIALLLAIIMPSLGNAKKLAQGVVCKSNLKQWHVCWKLYLTDNADKFTPGNTSNGSFYTWMDLMRPYYQQDVIFTCPSAKKELAPSGETEQWAGDSMHKWRLNNTLVTPAQVYSGSYGYNYWVSSPKGGVGDQPEEYHWGSDLVRSDKSNIPLFMDSIWIGGYAMDTDTPHDIEDDISTGTGQMNRSVMRRHRESVQLVFLDGSAKKPSLPELWTLKWHREFDTCNPLTQPDYDWPDWIKD